MASRVPNGSSERSPRTMGERARFAVLVVFCVLGLLIGSLHAAQVRIAIQITPQAATLIRAVQQGMPVPTALSRFLPPPGSPAAFHQQCTADHGEAIVDQAAGIAQRICL